MTVEYEILLTIYAFVTAGHLDNVLAVHLRTLFQQTLYV